MSKPKIRVKGYKDDWEQRKLGDVFEQTTNFVNLDEDKMELWSLTVEDGLTPKSERYNREFLVKKDTNFKEVRPGDIVYNPMNMTLGAVGYNGMAKSVAVSGYYTTMVANAGYDSYYINTWLKSPYAISLYKTFATGSLKEKQRVQFPTLSIIPTVFPKTEEQKKIGQFFENLDRLITLHHRKLNSSSKRETFAWEQRKLGEVADIVGGGTPSTNVSDYWDGDIDWYAPAEISDQIYLSSSQRKITEEGYNNSSAKILPIGTVLFTSRAGIGKTAILRQKGCTNQGFQSIVPHKDELDSYFIFSRTEELKKYGETVGAGSTFVEVSGKQMANMELMMPKTIREQEVIGAYFAKLDHLITLHQRKCDETKKLKKYMLQKMFPQNGNKVPEIRFFGFTDDWEQRKFNEFVKNVAKKNKDNLDLEPFAVTNDRGFIAQKDAHEDFGYMKDTDRRAYNIVPPNSFAYNPARINVGSLGYYAGTENVIVSSLYEVFQTEDFIDDRFLWHWLKSEHFPKWIEKLQEGSVRLYFYFDKLIQCQMMIPSVEEQKIISEYLDRIDTLITLHHRKYEELQKIKKFMLQNMFV